ncbi:MAG: nuclear transport factor 2 family protein [Porticoccaceae bacterium]|nr:nuclear transport factor 2 family protein [Porticoccaceae bacterium]
MLEMDNAFTQKFAREWVAAWNSHDLDEILSHYTDDFEMTSPIIGELMDEPGGTLKGKELVGAYWSKALTAFPDLRFEFLHAFAGVNSVVVYYKGPRSLSAEVFYFNHNGKVEKAFAHYE